MGFSSFETAAAGGAPVVVAFWFGELDRHPKPPTTRRHSHAILNLELIRPLFLSLSASAFRFAASRFVPVRNTRSSTHRHIRATLPSASISFERCARILVALIGYHRFRSLDQSKKEAVTSASKVFWAGDAGIRPGFFRELKRHGMPTTSRARRCFIRGRNLARRVQNE